MPPSGDHWTAERVQELRERWASGEPTRSIARAMGLTNNQVVGKAHRLKLPSRGSPLGYKVWTAERHAKIEELRAAGASLSECAVAAGVDTETARKWLAMGAEAIAAKVKAKRRNPAKTAPAVPVKRHATRVTVRPKSQPLPEPRIVAPKPVPAAVPLSKHAKCQFPRWPNGARRGHPAFGRFCDAPAALGRSYCPACCAVAYRAEAA